MVGGLEVVGYAGGRRGGVAEKVGTVGSGSRGGWATLKRPGPVGSDGWGLGRIVMRCDCAVGGGRR